MSARIGYPPATSLESRREHVYPSGEVAEASGVGAHREARTTYKGIAMPVRVPLT